MGVISVKFVCHFSISSMRSLLKVFGILALDLRRAVFALALEITTVEQALFYKKDLSPQRENILIKAR